MVRGIVGATGLLVAFSLGVSPSTPIPQRPDSSTAPGETVGTPSCSARSCHGGDEPLSNQRIGQHEYTKWNFSDPHTQAYQTLFGDRSAKMIELLRWKAPAFEQERCLACHAQKGREHGVANLGTVGCESCHGRASNWLDAHTLGPGWRTNEKYKTAAAEFVDVTNLADLARRCAGCHVGSPVSDYSGIPRDMNHDMIAAGHPVLRFEFAGYLAQLPEHWKTTPERHAANYFARAWAVGQAVSAEAALDLLQYRAEQPTWPELAEFACYACHHSLAGPKGWRAELGSKGSLPWGSWPLAALKSLAPDDAGKFDQFAAELGSRPEGKSVARKAAALKLPIEAIAKKFEKNADYAALRKSVATSLKSAARRNWDGAAQLYLAMAALSPDADRAKLAEFWNELRQPGGFSAKREQYLQKLDALLDFAGAK